MRFAPYELCFLKESAIQSGHLTSAQYDQWVKPESMVGIKIKVAKKK